MSYQFLSSKGSRAFEFRKKVHHASFGFGPMDRVSIGPSAVVLHGWATRHGVAFWLTQQAVHTLTEEQTGT